jgi:hypothetical protein
MVRHFAVIRPASTVERARERWIMGAVPTAYGRGPSPNLGRLRSQVLCGPG